MVLYFPVHVVLPDNTRPALTAAELRAEAETQRKHEIRIRRINRLGPKARFYGKWVPRIQITMGAALGIAAGAAYFWGLYTVLNMGLSARFDAEREERLNDRMDRLGIKYGLQPTNETRR